MASASGGVTTLEFSGGSEQVVLVRGSQATIAGFSADGAVTARFEAGRGLVVRRGGDEEAIAVEVARPFDTVVVSPDGAAGRRRGARSGVAVRPRAGPR